MTADQASRRAIQALLAQTTCGSTQETLLRAALIVSHGAAISVLERSQFSWEDAIWGNPQALSSSLIAIYDDPRGQRLLGLFKKLWLLTEPNPFVMGIGFGMPSSPDWPKADTYLPDKDCVGVLDPEQVPSSADPRLIHMVLGQLIGCAHDWLSTHPMPDGLVSPPLHSVTRSAEFARLFLDAVARASPGAGLSLPDLLTTAPANQTTPAGLASEVRQRLRYLLPHDLEFSLLSHQEKQALSERLLLMPMFLAAIYEYGRLAAEPQAQEMASELANQYLHEFFGITPYRTHFDSFDLLPRGFETACPALEWRELQDGQLVPDPLDLILGGNEDNSQPNEAL